MLLRDYKELGRVGSHGNFQDQALSRQSVFEIAWVVKRRLQTVRLAKQKYLKSFEAFFHLADHRLCNTARYIQLSQVKWHQRQGFPNPSGICGLSGVCGSSSVYLKAPTAPIGLRLFDSLTRRSTLYTEVQSRQLMVVTNN